MIKLTQIKPKKKKKHHSKTITPIIPQVLNPDPQIPIKTQLHRYTKHHGSFYKKKKKKHHGS